jgi:hypothetical protein
MLGYATPLIVWLLPLTFFLADAILVELPVIVTDGGADTVILSRTPLALTSARWVNFRFFDAEAFACQLHAST